MIAPDPESSLERIRRRLYGSAEQRVAQQAPAGPVEGPEMGTWEEMPKEEEKKGLPIAALFLMIAVGFFVIAGLVSALILFLGGRSVSTDRIEILVEGPASVAGGEEVPLDFIIENRNPVAATAVSLSIDFPPEAYEAGGGAPLGHYAATLEDIPSGDAVRHGVRASFFGAEGESVSIPVRVEYKNENSNATFVKEATYDVIIATAPVSINIDARTEIGSGQPFTLKATVRSNSDVPLQNLAVRATYPSGLLLSSSVPEAVGNAVFPIGTLMPGEEAEIELQGSLSGVDGDEKVFKFFAGALTAPESVTLAKPEYTVRDITLKVSKPFLAISASVNQKTQDPFVIRSGESVQALLTYANALTTTIEDASIEVALSGNGLDPESISAANGTYRSRDGVVVFDRGSESGLRSVRPEDSGVAVFAFAAKKGSALSSLRSPVITLSVSVGGRILGEGREERLNSILTRTVKIATDLTLTADALHTTGPFDNVGPFPPQADRETTYTIRWIAANTVNSVADTKVVAILPSNVRYTGQASLATGISYNEFTREVTWDIGEMMPGTSRNVSFQVGLTPNAEDSGDAALLVPATSIRGFDRFVQEEITFEANKVTTELEHDPGYDTSDGRVQ